MNRLTPIIEYKHPESENEFEASIDSRLRIILFTLAGFVYHNFGKTITITELMRTQEQQDEYYANNPDYKKEKWSSPHQFGRGADLRITYYTDEEIQMIELFLNLNFKYNDYSGFETALVHNTGMGRHLHIQVNTGRTTDIVKV